MDKLKALLAKPGAMRLISVVYWCAIVAAKALGLTTVVAALGFAASWIPSLPVQPDEAVGIVISVIALVKMLVQSARAPKPAEAPKA